MKPERDDLVSPRPCPSAIKRETPLDGEMTAAITEVASAVSGRGARHNGQLDRIHALPEQPLHLLRPSHGWVPVDLRELWRFRELLYFLAWRDIKVRYKQTVLGIAWAVIQPLFTMLIFTLFFGRLAGMPSDNIPYPLFAYAGLLPWTFFASAVTNSGNSLVGSANLISKVYFPRVIVPGATALAALVDFAIAFVLLAGMMVYYDVGVGWNLLMLPVLIALTIVLAVGVGLWMSAMNVKYRDVRYALPFLIQIGLFITPIIYPASIVPEHWRWLLHLNPLAGIIESYRAALFDRPFNWPALGLSAAITAVVFIYSAFMFRRMEKTFADVI